MGKIGRRAFSTGMATLAACGGRVAGDVEKTARTPLPSEGSTGVPSALPAEPAPPGLACGFSKSIPPGVTDVSFGVQTLYSWTTKDQAQALRRDKVLYTKQANDQGEPGYLFKVLEAAALRKDSTIASAATLLGGPTFRLGRYAWPFPWATQITTNAEHYGVDLIRVDLKPDALIVFVDESWAQGEAGDILVSDTQGRRVAWLEAQKTPERIGALYFVSRGGDSAARTGCFFGTLGPGLQYREFHLCNEAMVASWSIGTLDNLAQIERDVGLMDTLLAQWQVDGCLNALCRDTANAWTGLDRNRAGSSLPDEAYMLLTHFHLAPLAASMRADLSQARERLRFAMFNPDPLVHTPGT